MRSLRAERNSRNTLCSSLKGSQVVYFIRLYEKTGAVDDESELQRSSINSKIRKISHRQGTKFPLNGGCFRK